MLLDARHDADRTETTGSERGSAPALHAASSKAASSANVGAEP